MAKLSAHGYEVARLIYTMTIPVEKNDFDYRHHGLTERCYEVHLSFRSDGHILRRHVGLDTHPGDTGSRRRRDFGWTLWKKLPHINNPSLRSTVERQRDVAGKFRLACKENDTFVSLTPSTL